MKTSEELAEEYVARETTGNETYEHGVRNGFLAGYQAAKNQLANADKVICNTTMQEIQAVDTGELMPITNLPTPANWISVKERLPEMQKVVVTFSKSTYLNVAHRVVDDNGWCWSAPAISIAPHEITHWMLLPEPPKEEK